MKRLTERARNYDGTAISKESLVVEDGLGKGTPSNYCCAIVTKLADYEDLEERGLLLKLPRKVGDTVYEVQKIRHRIQPLEIISVYIGRMGELYFYWELKDCIGIYQNAKGFGISQLGKTVFLTQSEAEEALKRMSETK